MRQQVMNIDSPVDRQAGRRRPERLHMLRRFTQLAFLLLLILAPIMGLFRIDILTGAFVIGGYQVWFSDFAIVIGLWFFAASVLVLTYSWFGAVFCGWMCPQGLLSELGTGLMHRLLGRKAGLSVDGRPVQVAARKQGASNWIRLCIVFLAGGMLFAMVPLLYFYPPRAVWHFVTFRHDAGMPVSIYWIYFVFVVVMLIDIVFIRHLMCRYFCIYRVWQHSFKTSRTMRIGYDRTRADECVKCGYCAAACAVELDPRHTEVYSGCTACGECIVACERLHEDRDSGGLLSYIFPGKDESPSHMAGMAGRLKGVLPFMAAGAVLLVFGVAYYSPYHISVGNIGARHTGMDAYVVHVANKRYRPATLHIAVRGLAVKQYNLQRNAVHFDSAGMTNVSLYLHADAIGHGLHRFVVRIMSDDGWKQDFPVQYYSVGDTG